MPMHDWTRVEAGICHAMHSGWIQEIHRALAEVLPSEYYCLPEQPAGCGYIEPLAVGDRLPDMPVFLEPGFYVNVPLERTYMAAWAWIPRHLQQAVKGSEI